jgi:AraC family transcriptional regulator
MLDSMKPETRSFYEQAVQRAIDHIAANLDVAIDLKSLADQASLSPFHFHRVFRGMVGETPLELIRRLRLERAAWRLARETSAVTEMAFDAGYETHEAFTRAFHACYGTSPTGFRRRKHPRVELAAACGVHFSDGDRAPVFIPRDSGGHAMTVEIKDMPELRVGAIRHVGPYNQIPQAFERLGAIAGPARLTDKPGGMMLAIYHDDPDSTPIEELRSDAGIVVPPDVPLPKGLTEQRIPPGRYARTEHVGPYERLGDAWARFMGEWLPSSGHRIGKGPSFEVYRNTPAQVPKEQLLTDLYISIA